MSATTDPGNKSPDQIERELEEERRRLRGTADELSNRLSVGSLIDEAMTRFSGSGGEFGRNLGRSVRDNPLPVALIGIGLAWMMAGGQDATDRRDGAFGRFRSGGDWDDREGRDDDYGGYASMSGQRPRHLRGDDRIGGIPRNGRDPHAGADSGRGVGEKARDAASSAAVSVSDAASRAAGAAGSAASSAGSAVSDAASATADAARSAGRSISRAGDEAYWRARHHSRRAASGLDDLIERQPLVAGALAFAAGAALGGLTPNTRAENRLMGEHAEDLRSRAGDAVADEAEKARAVAQAAADEARDMADEAAGRTDSETPGGEAMVEKAEAKTREAADRIGQAAKDEAERQNLGSRVDPKSG